MFTLLQRRRFAPRLWAVLAWLAVAGAMVALGRWQLVRADEKIALLEAAETARASAPVDVRSLGDADGAVAAAAAYRRVRAEGRWLPRRQFLWDNRAHRGRPGLEVVTPLVLDDGRAVLVDRGWMPLPRRREALPGVGVEAGARVRLVGLASRPSRGFAGGPAFVEGAPWPRWLQWFDYDAISGALDRPLVPVVLQPERAAGAGAHPDLLVENWTPAASGPEKHWSYAVQWFAMAAALTALFVAVNLRPRPCARDAAPDLDNPPSDEP